MTHSAAVGGSWSGRKQRLEVLGQTMAYVEVGSGDPIVLMHGNPTSSYLWRDVIPHLSGLGRCIAPDLIGMGDSDKLPDNGSESYTFVEHRRYLDALLDQLGVRERVTLVIHDWGSALGFDWANRHRDAIKAMAYLEAIVFPLRWAEFPPEPRRFSQALRSPAVEVMVLEQNVFVERALPGSILRHLTDDEMVEYRRLPLPDALRVVYRNLRLHHPVRSPRGRHRPDHAPLRRQTR